MGAAQSTNSLFVQLEATDYKPGDVVRAVVCLNVAEPFDCASIEAELHGSSKSHWWTTVSRDGRTWREPRWGSWDFISASVKLPDTHRRFPAGQYQWPVVLALPADGPDSARIGTDQDGGRVTYKLYATCKPAKMMKSKMKVFQRFHVRSEPKEAPKAAESSEERSVVTCCCFSRGQVSGQLHVDRDWWRPGEPPITATVSVHNRTSKPIKEVEVALKQVAWISNATAAKRGWLSESKDFSCQLVQAKLPGVPPRSSLQGGQPQRVVLHPPGGLQATVDHGGMLTITYVVRLKMEMGFGTSDVKVKVPVRVYSTPLTPAAGALLEGAASAADAAVQAGNGKQEEEDGLMLPFLTQPPPYWAPSEVLAPVAMEVPSAPPLPANALSPDAPFWVRAGSNSERTGAAPQV